jgi:hypothetical protein
MFELIGIWLGSNVLLFGWLAWQRILAPPRRSFSQPTFVGATLNQGPVVIPFARRLPSGPRT